MFALSAGAAIWLCSRPTDMRKAYDGLAAEARQFMGGDPLSGNLFVFMNRRRDRMKILLWDRHGFWLFCKRLEAGRFQLPHPGEAASPSLALSGEQLLLIIEGIDLSSIRRRKRYSLERAERSF